jgi:acyl-CoA dehydrogenase
MTILTDDAQAGQSAAIAAGQHAAGAKGVTLFLVDASLPSFNRGKNLDKLGSKR